MGHRAGGQLRLSVIVFLTLQHRVVVGGKLGVLHSHSCSVEVEISPPEGDTIPFAEIEAEIKAQIAPLDGRILNDLSNFQGINPTFENFAAHLYNRLSLITAEYGAVLHSVIVHESPTRAVKCLRPVEQTATGDWVSDSGRDDRPGKVVRLPVLSPEEQEVSDLRHLRAPIGGLPLSPNQRPSSDFEPAVSADEEMGPDAKDQMEQVERTAAEEPVFDPAPPGQDREPFPDTPPSSSLAPAQYRQPPLTESRPEPPDESGASGDGPLPTRRQRKKMAVKKSGRVPGDQMSAKRPGSIGRKLAVSPTPAESREDAGADGDRSQDGSGDVAIPLRDRTGLLVTCVLLVFLAATAILYRKILWPPPGQGYPWGSDTWGHIRKAQFLLQEILNGNYFPSFSPMWYNGVEPFRYWAPLPYYVLAGLMRVLGSPFLAAGWYVAVCAFTGASGWLLMRNRFGLAQAGFAGFIWLFWQDNVRVAMSEGNLPRVLATAIFPYLLHCFLSVVEKPSERSAPRFAALACVSSIAIVAHAMIAATYFIGLTVVGVFWLMWMGIRSKDLVRGVLGIFSGIGLSAWWLVPSLQNGIIAIDKEAISEAMQFFSIRISMNPYLRLSQPEVFYWGVSLGAVALAVILTWKKRTKLSRACVFVGSLFVAVSTPALRPLYRSIPYHHLVFPLYLATMAAGIFLVAAFSWNVAKEGTRKDRLVRTGVSIAVLLILAVDSFASTGMIATRTEPSYLIDLAEHMPRGGWREATLDLSRFGSAATYILGQDYSRELVYGWAWQGATTGANIVNLNTALQSQWYPYLLDRLVELGATHIVARRGIIEEGAFLEEAGKHGFTENWRSSEGIVLTSEGGPYALRTEYSGIVIGRFASNWAQLFPSLATGVSIQIDSYEYENLSSYPTIVVSGAAWEDRTKAEDLLNRLASAGHRVVVDLEGLPEDVLSKRPLFMGVTGEPIMLYKAPTVYAPGTETPDGTVQAFDERHYPWKAHTPQGVEHVELQFPYLGETVTVLGSKNIGTGSVWFIGANLPYHAYLTRDPYAVQILSSTMGVQPGVLPERSRIPLFEYSSGAEGYSFGIKVPGPNPVSLIIPVAARDNMIVAVDDVQVKSGSLHNLITVELDPGDHSVDITPQYPTALRPAGWVSFGFAMCLAILVTGQAVSSIKAPVRRQVLAG